MDIGGDNPVTLVVKAPNQRIADQTVDCFLEWTVRKLKEHLENVYPSKPKHNQQKLIYSGQLLQDHVTLKEVLRMFDEPSQHTLHLVCANMYDNYGTETVSEPVYNSTPSSTTTTTSAPQNNVRYRGVQPMPEIHNFQTSAMPPMMAPGGYGYSPDQYLYMQQMYSQYMSQYMQYYNNAYQTNPATPVSTGQTPVAPRPANPNQRNNVAERGAPNPNMRMNAQGGMVEDDEEDQVENRDWLDYIYVMFRFLVLLSIVYFYSTFSRFVAVFTGFVLIYLLQKGWLSLRRNVAREPREAERAADPVEEPEARDHPQQDTPQQNETDEAVAEEESPVQADTHIAEQPKPGFLPMVWCFFSTFVTSLVPHQPAAVNAN